jgi:nucleotide-binding universal stress UspA family protein
MVRCYAEQPAKARREVAGERRIPRDPCCSPARHQAGLAAGSVRRRAPAEHPLIVARKLVIGYDGTPEGEDALALARVLAPALGAAELVAVCVKAVAHPRPRGHGWRERLEQEAERTLAGATGDDLRRRAIVSSSPARGLFELAEREGADLLVVGSSHHSGLGAVLAGSVGRALLQGAPCPVALAPRGYHKQDVDRLRVLGVGFDGSAEAERALDETIELARGAEATMRVIAALTPVEGPYDGVSRHETLQEEVGAAVDRCPPELRADGRTRKGAAVAVLRDEADMGIDLLVLGSRGYGPVLRTWLGSVTAELVRSAPCPLLLVPRHAPGGRY